MTPKEKKRFEEMAEKDKARYEKEMANYIGDMDMEGTRVWKGHEYRRD